MKKFLTISCICSFLFGNAQTTTLTYDIIIGGKTLGFVTATKTEKGNKVVYTSDSDTEVNLIGTTTIKTRMKTIFEDGILTESTYKFFKNDKLKEEAKVIKIEKGYLFTHDGETSKIDEPITASTIMLYFYTPKEGEKIFEEVEGYFKTITYQKPNHFFLIDPKSSHKDTYEYKNGLLNYNLVKNTLIDFEMVLQENKIQK
tara:strand:- start:3857 stop:4459 length:603 start_codon:yes stop_codon:yes gene_type:complete